MKHGLNTDTETAGSLRADIGLSGCEAGKFTGSCHFATASCRLMRKFYRIATASCRFIWKFYRFLPHQSTQVVDFPRIRMVRHFRESLNLVLATDATQMQERRIYKEGRNGGKQEKKEGSTTEARRHRAKRSLEPILGG
jgi:hypothetical protein